MGANAQGAEGATERWLTIPRTLCFVLHGDEVLLMKRGAGRRVFPNQYNGLGGHIERGEDPLAGALREIHEESGLRAHSPRLRGIHHIDAGGERGILLFVYTAISQSKRVRDCGAEGRLEWARIDRVLELDLVEDLPALLPRILAMKDDEPPYQAHVSYDENDKIVIRFHGETGA